MEKWKSVIGYEGLYEISDLGRVRSVDKHVKTSIKHSDKRFVKGKILKQNLKKSGYLTFDASKEGKTKTLTIHREVAKAFIPNKELKPCVNHINAKKTDNRLVNLEWCTHKENSRHASQNNLFKPSKKQILCVEENKVFESSVKAAEWLNETKYNYTKNVKTTSKNIRRVCAKGRKSAYGYRWKDLD